MKRLYGHRTVRVFLAALQWITVVADIDDTYLVTSVEYLPEPLGLETQYPRFSWYPTAATSRSLPRGTVQHAYRLQVANSPKQLKQGSFVWDSGSVISNSSVLVAFNSSQPLARNGIFWWRVQPTYITTDGSLVQTPKWSLPARFSIGPDGVQLLKSASFIGAADAATTSPRGINQSACPWLRKRFALPAFNPTVGDVALVVVGSVGFHELWVNGQKANDDVLAPAVSDLAKRVLLRTYDVTKLLKKGSNAIGLWLSVGWAGFDSVNPSMTNLFNTTAAPVAVAELRVTHGAGHESTVLVVTNSSWKSSPSDTAHIGKWTNSNFGGDRVDVRLSQPDWASAGMDDAGWAEAVEYTVAGRVLTNDVSEPNRLRDQIPAKTVQPWRGAYLVEMEQVFTGFVYLRGLCGTAGDTVKIKASSIPVCGTPAASFAARHGKPFCSDAPEYNMQHEVIIGENGTADFACRFSYHEVHFLLIEGLSRSPAVSSIKGYRVGNIAGVRPEASLSSAGPGTGRSVISTFKCASPLLTRIYDVSMWTMANLVTGGMSVDCPHRERLGYLGDAHTSLETALQNVASGAFYTKWLQDIQDVQGFPAHTADLINPTGYIPHTAPTIDGGGGPSWSGFVIIMPWQVYLAYDDQRILSKAYPSMVKLLQFWDRSRSKVDGLVHDWGVHNGKVVDPWTFLGDWVTPHGDEQPPSSGKALPEAELFNNCYILYCTRIVANASLALGFAAAATRYQNEADAMAAAIHAKFFVPASSAYLDTRQTHLVMPLVAGAVPARFEGEVWSTLRNEILSRQGGHVDTGLQGTYFMTKLFTDSSLGFGGEDALIHTFATNPTAPGYADLLSKGFTTWPEAWGTCKDQTSQPFQCPASNWTSGSTSPAHGCLNGIGQWFVSGLGGIRRAPGYVGYQRFELRPAYGIAGMPGASATFVSPYGEIASSWSDDAKMSHVKYNITVPPNTRAYVYLRADDGSSVFESGRPVNQVEGVRLVRTLHQNRLPSLAIFDVGSGQYAFQSSRRFQDAAWV